MSNDLTKVYQFLSSYNQNGKTWVDSADKNGDDIIIKAEFTEFVNNNYKNWSGNESGETLSADIINNFWKKIDTKVSGKVSGSSKSNRNALDKNEQANLDKKLEAYVALNDFVKENVTIPSVLTTTGAQWKAAVTDELLAILEKNASKGAEALVELWTEQLPAIENKQTALFCATEYQNSLLNGLLKDYPDYKVADDSTLNKLITSYLKTINGESDPATIKTDIQEIMKTYLATAGLGEGGSYDLSTLGYEMKDGDKLNGIQEAVAKASIKKNLEGIKSDANYEKYKEYYDKAIEEFINAEVGKATAGTFEATKAIGLEMFRASDAYKKIQLKVEFDTVFENTEIVDTNKLYKALNTQFGKTIAERIVKDGVYMSAYTKIIAAALEKVNAGEFVKEDRTLDVDAVLAYVVTEISKNLNSFTEGIFGDMSLAELKDLYTKISTNADNMNDKEAALKAKRNAAIDYCTTITAKSTSLKQAVIDVFGENYANKINSMYPSEIESAMKTLFAAVATIGDSSQWELTGISGLPTAEASMNAGATQSYTLTPTINTKNNGKVDPSKISYDVTGLSGGTVKFEDGKMMVTSNAGAKAVSGRIIVYYDGSKIGTPVEFSIKVAVTLNNEQNIKIGDKSLAEILNSAGNFTEIAGWHRNGGNSLRDTKEAAKTSIRNVLSQLGADLKNAGYDAQKVDYAVTTTRNFYCAAIDAMFDCCYSNKDSKTQGISFSYLDGNGSSCSAGETYYQYTRKKEKDAATFWSGGTLGIQMNESYNNTNTYKIALDYHNLLINFMKFMNAI